MCYNSILRKLAKTVILVSHDLGGIQGDNIGKLLKNWRSVHTCKPITIYITSPAPSHVIFRQSAPINFVIRENAPPSRRGHGEGSCYVRFFLSHYCTPLSSPPLDMPMFQVPLCSSTQSSASSCWLVISDVHPIVTLCI